MNDCLCLCHLLKTCANCSERSLSRSLSQIGVSHCQAQILLRVRDGETSMSKLSRILGCHKSNITQIADGLKKLGLIECKRSEQDKRMWEIQLTAKGKAASGKLKKALDQEAEKCMAMFSKSEKETLARLLKKYALERL